jgi:N-acetylglucosaminyldiphosphoundecaprenol N-acetyl-beta-D-mannosaminyltransferase
VLDGSTLHENRESPRAAPPQRSISAFGPLAIDAVRRDEAVRRVLALVDAGRGGAVFTPNVHHVVRVYRDPAFRESYAKASLLLADGMPLVWASRLLGCPLPERVAGSDVLEPLLEALAERRARIGFLGGRVGAAERLRERVDPRLTTWFGPPTRAMRDATAVDAAMSDAQTHALDLLIVSLASPEQEHACARWITRLAPTVTIGLGSAPDQLAGLVGRAPRVLREHGLEWAYRLATEPRRLWRRYVLDAAHFALILIEELRKKLRKR